MSQYNGSTPRWERRFRKHLAIFDVIHGRKVIVPRTVSPNGIIIEPGGIRRATNRFGKPIHVPGGITPEFKLQDGTSINPSSK